MLTITALSLTLLLAIAATANPLLQLLPTAELEGRITHGDVAHAGQFPYQAGLSLLHGASSAWCGGTLISNLWIVTAAHCADGADGVIVYLGALYISVAEKGQQRLFVHKSNIIVHEHWNPNTLANDIALLKLPVSIEFNERIRAATLPRISERYANYAGELAYATGWGRDSDGADSVSPVLRYVEMPVLKQNTCNIYWLGVVSENTICMSTNNGRSTCNGDSGGPLVHKDGDINYLIGATSYGLALGCERGQPTVFTRITSYLDWIKQHSGVENK